jgi:N-acyl-D-amino-acid deacylase
MCRVAEVLREYGGVYASHIRDEGDQIIDALDEAIEIGAAGDANTILSHHKLIGPKNHGRSVETLKHVSEAIKTKPVALDCYPYAAGSTILRKDRLPVSSRVIVTKSVPFPQYAGQDLDVIAAQMGLSPEDAVDALQPAGAIYFVMDEQDVQRILAFEHTMIGSDGMPHDTAPHPRLWGTFPRVLGHYCRDVGLFTLEQAVHKMTGLTAGHFKLPARGLLAPGYFADVTIFEAATVADKATWDLPTLQAQGIAAVIVNGSLSWQDGVGTGARAGCVIRLTDPPIINP